MTKEITLYVTGSCPYCHAALDFVKRHQYPHKVVALDHDPSLRTKLSRENDGWRTVPMIFVGDAFIGGYTDMMALAEQGALEGMLHG